MSNIIIPFAPGSRVKVIGPKEHRVGKRKLLVPASAQIGMLGTVQDVPSPPGHVCVLLDGETRNRNFKIADLQQE